MEVTLALLADYANVADNKLNVMGIFRQILASKFPARHPQMRLILSLEAGPAELGSQKTIEIKLLDADGNQKWAIRGDLTLPDKHEGGRIEVNHILTLNDLIFDKPGPYAFHILINGDEKKSLPFSVEQTPAPAK